MASPHDDAPPGFARREPRAPRGARAVSHDDAPPPGFATTTTTRRPSKPRTPASATSAGWWAAPTSDAGMAPLRELSPAVTPASSHAVPFDGSVSSSRVGRRASGASRASPAPPRMTTTLPSRASPAPTPSSSRRPRFKPHWPATDVTAALAAGTAFAGTLRAPATGRRDVAYVTLPSLPADIMVRGAVGANRSIDGDVVAIVVREEGAWWVSRGGTPAPQTPGAATTGAALAAADADLAAAAAAAVRLDDGSSNDDDDGATLASTTAPTRAARRALASLAARLSARPDVRATADVVAIITPSARRARWVGLLEEGPAGGPLLRPTDPRLPPAIVRGAGLPAEARADLKAEARAGEADAPRTLLLACYGEWPHGEGLPPATVTSILGPAGDLTAETDALLAAAAVDAGEFPAAALAELPALPWSARGDAAASRGRIDLTTSRRIFSIDPPTARDLDDALSLERVEDVPAGVDGVPPPAGAAFRLGVHIADVSAFVPPNGPLDAAARARATSVYLVTSVVPMLPRVLCESLCSLEPGVERFSFSVDVWLDGEGRVVGQPVFYRAIMQSVAKLAYSDAQTMLDAPDLAAAAAAGEAAYAARATRAPSGLPPPRAGWRELAADTRALWTLASARRAARFAAGALRLDNTKLVFTLCPTTGAPLAATPHEHQAANQLVEECMLLANECAARRLAAATPSVALLRRHPPPSQRKLDELAAAVAAATGVEVDTGSAGALRASLSVARAAMVAAAGGDAVAIATAAARGAALTLMCTKPMQVAAYVCAGEVRGGRKREGSGRGDDGAAATGGGDNDHPTTDAVGSACAHYALAVRLYTHFTSPIRRYPDVLVHRMLAATLVAGGGGGEGGAVSIVPPSILTEHGIPPPDAVAEAAAHCNERKAAAKSVQDASGRLFLAAMLSEVPRAAVAVVTSVGGARFFDIHVPALGVDVRISVEEQDDVAGAWDAEGRVLTLTPKEGGGGRGDAADASPPPRHLHNPDNLAPAPLPQPLTLLTPIPVVITAVKGTRGDVRASVLAHGGRWARAAAVESVGTPAVGTPGVMDDLLGAD